MQQCRRRVSGNLGSTRSAALGRLGAAWRSDTSIGARHHFLCGASFFASMHLSAVTFSSCCIYHYTQHKHRRRGRSPAVASLRRQQHQSSARTVSRAYGMSHARRISNAHRVGAASSRQHRCRKPRGGRGARNKFSARRAAHWREMAGTLASSRLKCAAYRRRHHQMAASMASSALFGWLCMARRGKRHRKL